MKKRQQKAARDHRRKQASFNRNRASALEAYCNGLLCQQPHVSEEVVNRHTSRRLEVFDQIAMMKQKGFTPTEYVKWLKEIGVKVLFAVSTLYRLMRVANDDPARLGGNHHLSGRRTTLPLEQFVFYVAHRFEFPTKNSFRTYKHLVEEEAPARGWTVVHSEDRFRHYFGRVNKDLVESMLGREPNEKLTLGFHIPKLDLPPHKLWHCDSMEFGTYYFHNSNGIEQIVRPWVISFRDQGSRAVMGWWISPTKPGAMEFLLALRHALLPDGDKSWYAVPERIMMDNDPSFKTDEVRRCLTDLRIYPDYTPRKCPSQNGRIERFHRIIRDDYEADAQRFVVDVNGEDRQCHGLWNDLPAKFAKWVVKECKTRTMTELRGRTPFQTMMAGTRPQQLPTPEKVWKSICTREPYKVQSGGVKIKGRMYYCEQLPNYKGREVMVTIPPDGPQSKQMWVEVDLITFGPIFNLADAPEKAAAMEKAQNDANRALQNERRLLKGRLARIGRKAKSTKARMDQVARQLEQGAEATPSSAPRKAPKPIRVGKIKPDAPREKPNSARAPRVRPAAQRRSLSRR